MPNIFGADIAGKLAAALGPMLFDVTLHKLVTGGRDPDNPSGGNSPQEVSLTARGFTDEWTKEELAASLFQVGDEKIAILGATIPGGEVPKIGDSITSEGVKRKVLNVSRDPAGAVYQCHCR